MRRPCRRRRHAGLRLLQRDRLACGEVDLAGPALGMAHGNWPALVDRAQEQQAPRRVVGGVDDVQIVGGRLVLGVDGDHGALRSDGAACDRARFLGAATRELAQHGEDAVLGVLGLLVGDLAVEEAGGGQRGHGGQPIMVRARPAAVR